MIASDLEVDGALADIAAAVGEAPADLLLSNCQLVNVASNEAYRADIAIRAGRIVAIRPDHGGAAKRVVDCEGYLAVPGLVDLAVSDEALGPDERITCRINAEGAALSSVALWSNLMGDHAATVTAVPCQPVALCDDFAGLLDLLRNGTTPFLDLSRAEPEAVFAQIIAHPIAPSRLRLAGMAKAGPKKVEAAFQAALAAGLSLAQLYRMASFGPALSFGLDHMIGSIVPGRRADLLLLKGPADLAPAGVLRAGAPSGPLFL